MPYIPVERRYVLESDGVAENAGELNFLLTWHINSYLQSKGKSYQTYNDIIGALEGAKLELYARKVRPYEDKKKKENGDVY